MTQKLVKEAAQVPRELMGKRFDQVAAQLFGQFSRSRLQQWIVDGVLRVDGEQRQPRYKLSGGEYLRLEAYLEDVGEWPAQKLDFGRVYEDEDILVVNKPAGLVVHPAAGNPDGTLLNGLLYYCPALRAVPRAGIVHRLDKDTSGLMVVAKNLSAQTALVEQLQAHTVSREYEAITRGVIISGATVNAPVGRHPSHRTRMAVVKDGKPAVTHYRVAERYGHHTRLKVQLETGRTHQIRVHMSHRGYPLVGDPVYGGRARSFAGAAPELVDYLASFRRQALHAARLALNHPSSGELVSWTVPLADDIDELITMLKRYDAPDS